MRKKLLDSISIQINEIFGDVLIYTDHIKQGFKKNSFFIRIIKSSEKPYIANRYKLFNNIEITYTPESSSSIDFIFVKEKLFEKMGKLRFENKFILGENLHVEIEEGILKFYIEYNFYIFRNIDTEKMTKLFKGGCL